MPNYAYACIVCGGRKEELQPFGAAPPQCCGLSMQRELGNIIQVNFGKMSPTLRKLGCGSVPFTKGDKSEQYVRDKRAAVDYKSVRGW